MLTGVAKIGYLLAYSGVFVLIFPLLRILAGEIDGFYASLLVIGLVLFSVGLVLLRRDETVRDLGWRLLRVQPLGSGKDRVALALITFGTVLAPMSLSTIWSGGRFEIGLPFIAMALVALVVAWFLALSDFWKSRSLQK